MRKILSLLIAALLSVVAYSQNRQIAGRVLDDKGDPIPFASIKVKKSSVGTSADEAGNFKLSVPPNAILVVSAAGVETREVSTVGAGETITVSLARLTNELSTVVVTTSLGIKRQAKELGYAAASVTNKEKSRDRRYTPEHCCRHRARFWRNSWHGRNFPHGTKAAEHLLGNRQHWSDHGHRSIGFEVSEKRK